MNTINRRNTIQKTLILDAVMSMSNHPSADEIYDSVVEKCPNISKGTVYRNLNRLAEDGEILRVAVPNAPDRFDRTKDEHCHFKCLSCGKIIDLDAVRLDLDKLENCDSMITGYEIIIVGYCKDCKVKN